MDIYDRRYYKQLVASRDRQIEELQAEIEELQKAEDKIIDLLDCLKSVRETLVLLEGHNDPLIQGTEDMIDLAIIRAKE